MTSTQKIATRLLATLHSGNFTEAQRIAKTSGVDPLWLTYIEARQCEHTNPDQARTLYVQVAELANERGLIGAALIGAAICCGFILGQFEEGLALLDKALHYVDSPNRRSSTLNNRASIIAYAVHTGSFETERLREAIDIWLTLLPEQPNDESITNNLGNAYNALGDPVQAENYLHQSILIMEQDGVGGPAMASGLMNLGEALHGQQRLEEALAQFSAAQELVSAHPDTDPVLLVEIARNLAHIHQQMGDLAAAAPQSLRAIQTIESRRADLMQEQDRRTFLAMLLDAYQTAIAIALDTGDIERAFTLAEQARSRTLSEATAVETPLTAAQIQDALPDDLLLIAFYVVVDHYLAFVMTKSTLTVERLAVSTDDLTRLFDPQGYPRHIMPNRQGRLQQPWMVERIGEQLISPLASHLENAEDAQHQTLCIIPYGPLHYLPFQLWLDRSILYAPSATLLVTHCQRQIASNPREPLVAYGYNSIDLTHAEVEAVNIARRAAGTAHIGEEAIQPNLQTAHWLHFSCHGVHNTDEPLESYLLLADGPLTARAIMGMELDATLVTLSACESGRNQIQRGDEPLGLTRAFFAAGVPAVLVSMWPVDEVATRLLMEEFYSELQRGHAKRDALHLAQQRLRTYHTDELQELVVAYGHTKGKAEKIVERSEEEQPFTHPYWWAGFVLVGDRF